MEGRVYTGSPLCAMYGVEQEQQTMPFSHQRQVTINLPTPTTWRQNHDKYKGAKTDKAFKPVTIKFSMEEHDMLVAISDRLRVDYTNMLRQVIVSMHKELFNDVPESG